MTTATPLLMIPGLMCTGDVFRDQIVAISHQRPVLMADHRRADSIKAIAGQILKSAPPRFALAGLSMGGYVAFEIMRQAPQRVERLALIDTSAAPDSPQATATRWERIRAAREGRYLETAEAMFPGMVLPAHAHDKDLLRRYMLMAEETGAEAFALQQTAILGRPDSRPTLAGIGVKTVVIVGKEDQLTPPEAAKVIAAGIAGAKLVEVPDCGHLSSMERPAAVTQALWEWLA
jgi:pimeloyl-ACP methyl ester carboxylesterase